MRRGEGGITKVVYNGKFPSHERERGSREKKVRKEEFSSVLSLLCVHTQGGREGASREIKGCWLLITSRSNPKGDEHLELKVVCLSLSNLLFILENTKSG